MLDYFIKFSYVKFNETDSYVYWHPQWRNIFFALFMLGLWAYLGMQLYNLLTLKPV